jgi:LacI family transcriptional regulator
MAIIKDVAKKAGVSITTVSHVINQTRYVSDELTQKVHHAMMELNFQPNILARSLRIGRTKTIGLVIPDISNPFFAEISRKIEDKGFELGYNVILCNTDEDLIKEQRYINVLIAKQVDGIIFFSTGGSSGISSYLHDSELPLVVADRETEGFDTDVVLVDNQKGGYEATNYLISLNHRRIACISGPSLISPSAHRVEGYKKALQDANLPFDETLLRMGNFRFDGGEKEMRELLNLSNPPTAVFICNDMMALGAILEIKLQGKDVPGDFSIIGFDNSPLSKYVHPPLTTISQPMKKMAELVVELLIEKIMIKENQKRDKDVIPEYKKYVLEPELLIRDSCKKLEN